MGWGPPRGLVPVRPRREAQARPNHWPMAPVKAPLLVGSAPVPKCRAGPSWGLGPSALAGDLRESPGRLPQACPPALWAPRQATWAGVNLSWAYSIYSIHSGVLRSLQDWSLVLGPNQV